MNIEYKPKLPRTTIPICSIGAGGIVRDAHLPAYRKAGFEVFGIADPVIHRAEALAEQYRIPNVFGSAEEAIAKAPSDVIYDLALLPEHSLEVLQKLPDGAFVLIQKPLGESLEQAQKMYTICQKKKLTAAVNFQMRFAPYVLAARYIIDSGLLGKIYDLEVRLTTYTPWEIFPAVKHKDRLEIMYHSIHYIDFIRSFLGEPEGIMAKTFRHPHKNFSSTRSTLLFDYGDTTRAVINTNHDHHFGSLHQESFIKWEGTKGAIKARIGLLLNYPEGLPDQFEYCILQKRSMPAWKTQSLEGSWFPDAFAGIMASIMRYKEGSTDVLPTGIDDAIKTMAIAECAYASNNEPESRKAIP